MQTACCMCIHPPWMHSSEPLPSAICYLPPQVCFGCSEGRHVCASTCTNEPIAGARPKSSLSFRRLFVPPPTSFPRIRNDEIPPFKEEGTVAPFLRPPPSYPLYGPPDPAPRRRYGRSGQRLSLPWTDQWEGVLRPSRARPFQSNVPAKIRGMGAGGLQLGMAWLCRRETKQALRGRRSTWLQAQDLERVDGGGIRTDGMDRIVERVVGGGQGLGACHAKEVELE